ncbi:hypothetical protein EV360DRAFT_66420 [Lentinula raphanica]|nr:hypothetical protein EV360DRAFT_66420 [Lentinula raphanica]
MGGKTLKKARECSKKNFFFAAFLPPDLRTLHLPLLVQVHSPTLKTSTSMFRLYIAGGSNSEPIGHTSGVVHECITFHVFDHLKDAPFSTWHAYLAICVIFAQAVGGLKYIPSNNVLSPISSLPSSLYLPVKCAFSLGFWIFLVNTVTEPRALRMSDTKFPIDTAQIVGLFMESVTYGGNGVKNAERISGIVGNWLNVMIDYVAQIFVPKSSVYINPHLIHGFFLDDLVQMGTIGIRGKVRVKPRERLTSSGALKGTGRALNSWLNQIIVQQTDECIQVHTPQSAELQLLQVIVRRTKSALFTSITNFSLSLSLLVKERFNAGRLLVLLFQRSTCRITTDLALMHFRIVFFIVWLVAAACAAPIPQIIGAPSASSGDPNSPVMVKILYNSKGVPKEWGDKETVVQQKMQQCVLKALKSEEKPLFSEGREVKWEFTVNDKLKTKSKAYLTIFPDYAPCSRAWCDIFTIVQFEHRKADVFPTSIPRSFSLPLAGQLYFAFFVVWLLAGVVYASPRPSDVPTQSREAGLGRTLLERGDAVVLSIPVMARVKLGNGRDFHLKMSNFEHTRATKRVLHPIKTNPQIRTLANLILAPIPGYSRLFHWRNIRRMVSDGVKYSYQQKALIRSKAFFLTFIPFHSPLLSRSLSSLVKESSTQDVQRFYFRSFVRSNHLFTQPPSSIVFFIVWLVAVACAAPIPRPMPSSSSAPASHVVTSGTIRYSQAGLVKNTTKVQGISEETSIKNKKAAVENALNKAIKESAHLKLPTKTEVRWTWEPEEKKESEENTAEVTLMAGGLSFDNHGGSVTLSDPVKTYSFRFMCTIVGPLIMIFEKKNQTTGIQSNAQRRVEPEHKRVTFYRATEWRPMASDGVECKFQSRRNTTLHDATMSDIMYLSESVTSIVTNHFIRFVPAKSTHKKQGVFLALHSQLLSLSLSLLVKESSTQDVQRFYFRSFVRSNHFSVFTSTFRDLLNLRQVTSGTIRYSEKGLVESIPKGQGTPEGIRIRDKEKAVENALIKAIEGSTDLEPPKDPKFKWDWKQIQKGEEDIAEVTLVAGGLSYNKGGSVILSAVKVTQLPTHSD